jgi:DNA ligase D-like protein (predicted 3'-phosphoesterase)
MPFSKKFRKIMGFPKEGAIVKQFTVEFLSVDHVHIKGSKPRRYEYPVKMIIRGKASTEDVRTAFTPLLSQQNIGTTSGYGNPYSCDIGDVTISKLGEEQFSVEAKGRCIRVSDEVHRAYVAAMQEKLEEIALRVYDALFQDQDAVDIDGVLHRFNQTSASKIKFVTIEGYTFIEQNPRKDSKWGTMAQEGHRILWVCRGPAYLHRVMDGQFLSLKKRKRAKGSKTRAQPAEFKSMEGSEHDGVYVIQKHQATRLHFDLRLEMDGVLRSWAVPKMPPAESGVRRLAVQVEDHPLEYASFEGVIPEGEYGAGTVEIWDQGRYVLKSKRENKWIIEIRGKRLRGVYCLVQFKGEKNWLFFKKKDQAEKLH